MNRKQVRIIIIIIILVAALVGYYAFLSGRNRDRSTEGKMTLIEKVLARDLTNDYPPTPKEVMVYYNDIQKCLYGSEVKEEEIDELGLKMRGLFDTELLAQNEQGNHLLLLRREVEDYKSANRRLISSGTASSTNVDYYTRDGYSFARLLCAYTISDNGVSTTQRMVFLLRKDEDKRWKIYGWDLEANVDMDGDGIPEGQENTQFN